MARRRLGYGRGPRQRFEAGRADPDRRGAPRPHARVTGRDRDQEHRVVPQRQVARGDVSPAPGATKDPLTQVRPGHADLAGMQKYGFTDARDVLERASARETAARVAAGARGQVAPQDARHRDHLARHPDGLGHRAGRRAAPDARAARSGRREPGALLRSRRQRGDDRRDQGGVEGRRLARRRRRGARLRRPGRPRQPRALGSQARRAARAGDDEHPGREGRRDRRRVRGRRPAGERGPRSDPVGRRRPRVPP